MKTLLQPHPVGFSPDFLYRVFLVVLAAHGLYLIADLGAMFTLAGSLLLFEGGCSA